MNTLFLGAFVKNNQQQLLNRELAWGSEESGTRN